VRDRGARMRNTRRRSSDRSRTHHDPRNQPPGAQPTDANSEGRESEKTEHIVGRCHVKMGPPQFGPDILLWDNRTLSELAPLRKFKGGPKITMGAPNVNILGPQGAPLSRRPQNFMTPVRLRTGCTLSQDGATT